MSLSLPACLSVSDVCMRVCLSAFTHIYVCKCVCVLVCVCVCGNPDQWEIDWTVVFVCDNSYDLTPVLSTSVLLSNKRKQTKLVRRNRESSLQSYTLRSKEASGFRLIQRHFTVSEGYTRAQTSEE